MAATKTSTRARTSQTKQPSRNGDITRHYSTSLSHVGALLPDTKTMLAHWNLDADVPTNLARMQTENIFAKASRTRIPDMLATFRRRYLTDPQLLSALVTLMREDAPDALLNPILYFLAARADPLIADTVTNLLAPLLARGQLTVRTEDVERWLSEQVAAGRTQSAWSESTIRRLAQGLLSTLRDFGLLEGKATKRLAPAYLPVETFAFLAFLLSREQPSGDKLLHNPAWSLFFLSQPAVEQRFFEAQQERLLIYQAAGRVIRIDFPAETPEEFAHALTQRAL